MRSRNKDVTKFLSKKNEGPSSIISRHFKSPSTIVYSLKPEQFFLPKDIQLKEITQIMKKQIDRNEFHIDKDNRLSLSNIKRRRNIISKIKEFVTKYKLTNSTLYMATFYLDILILRKVNLSIEKAGIGSLILSMKYHDLDGKTPNFSKFTNFFGINSRDLCKIELECIKKLEYILTYSHISNFIQIICLYGIIYSDDGFSHEKLHRHVYDMPYKIMEYFIEDGINYLQYNPFYLALSCVCITREKLGIEKWNRAFDKYYLVTFNTIKEEYLFVNE